LKLITFADGACLVYTVIQIRCFQYGCLRKVNLVQTSNEQGPLTTNLLSRQTKTDSIHEDT